MKKVRFQMENGKSYPKWSKRSFIEIYKLSDLNRIKSIKKNKYLTKGIYPIIDQGAKEIGGYYNDPTNLINRKVIAYGDHTTKVIFLDFPFIKGAEGIKLLETTNDVDILFGYFLFKEKNIPHDGYKRHLRYMMKQEAYVPTSILEQKKIANFLRNFENYFKSYVREIELLKIYKKSLTTLLLKQSLKFSTFNKSSFPKWVEKELHELTTKIKSGKTPSTMSNEYSEQFKTIPFTKISDITKQGKYISFTNEKITPIQLTNSYSWIIPKNSLLYTIYASTGLTAINKIPLATSQAILGIIPDNTKINLDFMYYSLVHQRKKINKYIDIGTQSNLSLQTVKKLRLSIPNLIEQKKIGSFLANIDNYIELHTFYSKKILEYKKNITKRILNN